MIVLYVNEQTFHNDLLLAFCRRVHDVMLPELSTGLQAYRPTAYAGISHRRSTDTSCNHFVGGSDGQKLTKKSATNSLINLF